MSRIDEYLAGVEAGKTRKLIIFIVAVMYTSFHLITAGIFSLTSLIQTSIHVGFGLLLVFLLFPISKKHILMKVIDYIFILIAIYASVYVVLNYERFIADPFGYSSLDILIGTLLIITILEAARRTVGWSVPILALIMITYTTVGHLIPGQWGHGGLNWEYIVSGLFMTNTGIYGQIVLITATVVAIFLIFGAALEATGATDNFIGIALKLTGRSTGGPAKVSVVSSALFGTISGNAAANVAVTGNFTIPMMKRLHYPSHYAAGVEASASTLGQIMPPIMGASAFIMAQFLGVSYITIIVAAIIPALLFTLGIFMTIHFDAKKRNLQSVETLSNKEVGDGKKLYIPSWRELLSLNSIGILVLPIVILLYLIGDGYTIALSCFYAIVTSIGLFLIKDFRLNGLMTRLSASIKLFTLGARSLATIVPLIVCAQIIVSLLGKTGLGVKLGNLIVSIGADSLLLSLFAAMLFSLILGMGVPTTGAYVLGASMAAPALIELGIVPIAAHFFVLYFAVISAITPPICTGIFIASGIAGSSWLKSAITGLRLCFAAFIVPFIFAYNSNLMLIDGINADILLHITSAIIGVVSFCAMSSGYLIRTNNYFERILLGIAATMLIVPVWYMSTIGFALVLMVLIFQFLQNNMSNNTTGDFAQSSKD
ncbi:TRAP transporter permease [Salinibacillus xinjiangensis]|uniref:TRAP transporter fused permease subunit n=1 Tax=Salinibacillus xinjiangensis TaxID=1229268 RepID=A0A6G1X1R0_9BACI|nr:TRAP transporter fused permease subunit [Salinibacillus xinjiangensis]MRG84874.1 TRAP transporter fused permease subunit [Salinibacillus xinjiangensis]